ncbi:hypothetical protein DEO72_LG10g2637 [Vigna unguiculata]|uniref:Uncharacterized protein n=1 Tax=Vigna unguiculata TaxID=3917 RepID=A0A4D6NFB2_VIGUN|nr:hypothetical protein DEO72_LG10g2637 [Vigna unguiculata]
MNQPIKQPLTFKRQSIAKTQKRSRSSWSPRSGEKSALAQTAESRLGETATVAPGKCRELSLRRGSLAWARLFVAQKKYSSSPRRALEQKPGEFPLFSPGRDELAWASISVPTTVPRMLKHKLTQTQTHS